jgi:hypothetical protein
MTAASCAGCGSTDTAPTGSDTSGTHACERGKPGPPTIASAFADHLPGDYTVNEICAAEVGNGLADAGVVAELSDLAAGEFTQARFPPNPVDLKALVGTVKSGDGDAFVDAFLSGVGEARNDTVTLGGHIVRYFNTPGGEGYAYAEGPTVAIGYIPPPRGDLASTQESAKEIFTRILAAASGTPIPAVGRTESGIDSYSPGRGRHTTPEDPGWVFFKADSLSEIFCGIGPNGTVAGCDIVPRINRPPGANQTVVDASAPAHYAHSDTPTFTRDVDVLLPGHRLDNGDARCGMGYQGTVHCVIGEHSFVVSRDYGILE